MGCRKKSFSDVTPHDGAGVILRLPKQKKKLKTNRACTSPTRCERRRFVFASFLFLWKYCLKDERIPFAPPPGPQTSQWAFIGGRASLRGAWALTDALMVWQRGEG